MEKIKNWFKGAFLFLTSKIFLKNFAYIIGMFAAFLFLSFWGLKCYTNHGESREVPDLTGLHIDKAQKLAYNKKLKTIVVDTGYQPTKKPFVVLEQNPNPFSRVKENRNIYLTVNRATAPMTEFPMYRSGESLWGKQYNDVANALKNARLNSEVIARIPYEDAKNTVLEFILDGDTITNKVKSLKSLKIPMYSTVGLVVAESGSGKVEIPNLICRTYGEAKFLLSGMNLNLGTVLGQESENAYVYKQIPPFEEGRFMKMGEQMDIYLTSTAPEGCLTDLNAPQLETPSNDNEVNSSPSNNDDGADDIDFEPEEEF